MLLPLFENYFWNRKSYIFSFKNTGTSAFTTLNNLSGIKLISGYSGSDIQQLLLSDSVALCYIYFFLQQLHIVNMHIPCTIRKRTCTKISITQCHNLKTVKCILFNLELQTDMVLCYPFFYTFQICKYYKI